MNRQVPCPRHRKAGATAKCFKDFREREISPTPLPQSQTTPAAMQRAVPVMVFDPAPVPGAGRGQLKLINYSAGRSTVGLSRLKPPQGGAKEPKRKDVFINPNREESRA
jgi:hypothetical protein